ncbi:unnamed protein product [Mytilus edulis]|uniref:Uncharacterized protein n=1 Tax=Mytilus edulis TaxID=6550 RepID=A0A8S3R7U5_MYTED|nr:unnamed protein product [Mytilus edulis]
MLETESRPVTFKMTTATAQRVRHEGQEVDLHVQSVGSYCPITLSKVRSVKNLPISTHSAANNKDIKSIKHLSDMYIPEISSNKVLLLIGTNTPEAHIPIEVRSGSSHEPYASPLYLGWIVRGPINNTSTSDVVHINFEHANNVLLQQQLERLWTTDFLDQPSTEKVCMSLEDKRALKTMESTIAYEDGHYKLELPCNSKCLYTKGYAKEVIDVSNESSHIWYLPHNPVTKEHKPKEKEEEWIKWKSTLPEIKNISIPSCFKTKDMKDISDAQLHISSDGSEIGYGECAYLCLVDTIIRSRDSLTSICSCVIRTKESKFTIELTIIN